ncbi:MAG TPA: CHASE4 domain-containing protein [Opitutales bacterium]|nr:CHASE4 domain-containing protein [Opitutales bacterium]
MTLQRKTLTYVCVVLVLQLAVLATVSLVVHFFIFERLERLFAVKGADSVRAAVGDDVNRMGVLSDDYYCWNEMYEFAGAPDETFVNENLTATSLQSLGINVMVCLDDSGEVVLRRAVDVKGALTEVPESVLELARREAKAHSPSSTTLKHTGLAKLPEGVFVYAIRSILHNDRSGPSHGIGLMGRWLTRDILNGYEKSTGMELALNEGPLLPAASIPATISQSPDGERAKLDAVTIADGKASVILTFANEEHGTQFQLVASHELLVSRYGNVATWIIVGTIVFLTFAACFATVFLLNRMVLRRISGMAAQVREIAAADNADQHLRVDSADEIGRLAGDINALLDKILASGNDLRTKEAQLRLLIDKSPLAITISDRQGNVVFANERFFRMTGRNWHDLGTIGHMMEVAMPDPVYRAEKLAEMEENLKEADRTGLPARPVEYRATTAYGQDIDIELHIAQTDDLVFRIRNDVTERNRMTRELRDALDARGHFLANVSHEIRTPLNGIVGMTQILRDTKISPEQRDCVDTIAESCDLLVTIINDILDISKMESGTMTLATEPVELQPFIVGVMGLAGRNIAMKGLDFSCSAPDELPACVICDPNRLKQILLNLLSNATKFTDRGSVELRVSFEPKGGRFGHPQLRRRRQRHRHCRSRPRAHLQAFRAGGQFPHPPAWRRRPRSGDLRPTRGADGRAPESGERAGQRLDLQLWHTRSNPCPRCGVHPEKRFRKHEAACREPVPPVDPGGRGQSREPEGDRRHVEEDGRGTRLRLQRQGGRRHGTAQGLRRHPHGHSDAGAGRS